MYANQNISVLLSSLAGVNAFDYFVYQIIIDFSHCFPHEENVQLFHRDVDPLVNCYLAYITVFVLPFEHEVLVIAWQMVLAQITALPRLLVNDDLLLVVDKVCGAVFGHPMIIVYCTDH